MFKGPIFRWIPLNNVGLSAKSVTLLGITKVHPSWCHIVPFSRPLTTTAAWCCFCPSETGFLVTLLITCEGSYKASVSAGGCKQSAKYAVLLFYEVGEENGIWNPVQCDAMWTWKMYMSSSILLEFEYHIHLSKLPSWRSTALKFLPKWLERKSRSMAGLLRDQS